MSKLTEQLQLGKKHLDPSIQYLFMIFWRHKITFLNCEINVQPSRQIIRIIIF